MVGHSQVQDMDEENAAARETSLAHDMSFPILPTELGVTGDMSGRKKNLALGLQDGWTQHVLSRGLEGRGCGSQKRRDPLKDQTQLDTQNSC